MNIYSYLKTYGGKSLNPYLNVVHFFNNVLIRHLWQLKTDVFLHLCQICICKYAYAYCMCKCQNSERKFYQNDNFLTSFHHTVMKVKKEIYLFLDVTGNTKNIYCVITCVNAP
jgi:hypothetical protein